MATPVQEPTARPDPELRCSECNRPFTAQSCGLVHSITALNIAALRGIASTWFGGGRR